MNVGSAAAESDTANARFPLPHSSAVARPQVLWLRGIGACMIAAGQKAAVESICTG